jgi:hypothetical protein
VDLTFGKGRKGEGLAACGQNKGLREGGRCGVAFLVVFKDGRFLNVWNLEKEAVEGRGYNAGGRGLI